MDMTTLNKILDAAANLSGSDSATARTLGVSRQAVSNWRHGGKIEPRHIAKLINLAQQDPALAVQVLAEQGASKEEQRLWGALWDRLSPVTSTVAGALLMLGLWAPSPALAKVGAVQAEPQSACTLCAIIRRRLAAWLARLAHRPRFAHATPVLA